LFKGITEKEKIHTKHPIFFIYGIEEYIIWYRRDYYDTYFKSKSY